MVVALGLTGSVGHGSIGLSELWPEHFSRVLSNGYDSMYLAGSDGLVFNLKCLPLPSKVEYAPHRLGAVANWCVGDHKVALVLNRNGEILVFKDQRLQFAKRRGAWRYYPHDSVVRRLAVGTLRLRKAVYESCLDVSFARAGGCLAVVSAPNVTKAGEMLQDSDRIVSQSGPRTKLLKAIVKKPFHKLDRRLRQELLSMDGATLVTHTGEVLTAGAIIAVPSGSTGGGRKAAALRLSKCGLAIKMSADGPIEGFKNREPIFSL